MLTGASRNEYENEFETFKPALSMAQLIQFN